MIRQARRYLVGAASSVTLVSIAIVVFVVLVSAQVFRDWPIGALGGNDGNAAVSSADALSQPPSGGVAAPKTVAPGTATANAAAPKGGAPGASQAGGGTQPSANHQAGVGSSDVPGSGSGPVATTPSKGGSGDGEGSEGDPSSSSQSQQAVSGGGSTSNASSSGGSGSGSGSKSGSGSGGGGPVETITSGSTSAKVTETVNNTVNQVDETVTGGALKETGVTQVTEEVVNGVAGPESVVGKTVDEVGSVVGGLLGGSK
jgi:hypothetical protein